MKETPRRATLSTLIREFDNPLVHMAGVTIADSELAAHGDGYEIVTMAEHRLYASYKTIIHRQTLEALKAGRGTPDEFIREHIVEAHFKAFGDRLRPAVEAAELAWMRHVDPDKYAQIPDPYKEKNDG